MIKRFTSPIGRQWLTVVAVVMAIAVNGLSNVYPPAGKNIGEVSNRVLGGVLITPAGYAFAIWGLIYLGLIVYSVYQALPRQRHNIAVAKTSWALIGACCLQIAWVYAFLILNFWLSVGLMFGILACLIAAYLCTRSVAPDSSLSSARRSSRPKRPTGQVRWLLQAPISVYLGWITVAAVVNVAGAALFSRQGATTMAVSTSALSTQDVVWTVVMMGVSGAIAAIVALQFGDASFPAVAVWALCAIAVRQAAVTPIAFMGIGLAVGLCVVIVRVLLPPSKRT
ncbi:MAG: tryptophan-rich sensory protein [Phormidesmis sp. RL_2_1]|nr:tryptophan-rich sensory protein [Phormidesmis sp. RL_2_1]